MEYIIVATVIIVAIVILRSSTKREEAKYKKWCEISNNAREQRIQYHEQDLERNRKIYKGDV